MKIILSLAMIVAGVVFGGCEAVVTDRRPVGYHRYGHSDSSYHGRSGYYDDGVTYRSRPSYRSSYYERPRTTNYYGRYERTRAPYYSTSRRAPVVSIHRTEVRGPYANRGNQHSYSEKKYRAKKEKKDRDRD